MKKMYHIGCTNMFFLQCDYIDMVYYLYELKNASKDHYFVRKIYHTECIDRNYYLYVSQYAFEDYYFVKTLQNNDLIHKISHLYMFQYAF